jgi:dimeric dUTPase (all-alpha-NTP-PPase superfamily)
MKGTRISIHNRNSREGFLVGWMKNHRPAMARLVHAARITRGFNAIFQSIANLKPMTDKLLFLTIFSMMKGNATPTTA